MQRPTTLIYLLLIAYGTIQSGVTGNNTGARVAPTKEEAAPPSAPPPEGDQSAGYPQRESATSTLSSHDAMDVQPLLDQQWAHKGLLWRLRHEVGHPGGDPTPTIQEEAGPEQGKEDRQGPNSTRQGEGQGSTGALPGHELRYALAGVDAPTGGAHGGPGIQRDGGTQPTPGDGEAGEVPTPQGHARVGGPYTTRGGDDGAERPGEGHPAETAGLQPPAGLASRQMVAQSQAAAGDDPSEGRGRTTRPSL